MTTPTIDQIRYLKSNFCKLGDLGLLLLELGAEVAPFVGEAVEVASPFLVLGSIHLFCNNCLARLFQCLASDGLYTILLWSWIVVWLGNRVFMKTWWQKVKWG